MSPEFNRSMELSVIILDGSDNQLVDFGWREWVSRGWGISRDSTPKIGTKAASKNRYRLILFSSYPKDQLTLSAFI